MDGNEIEYGTLPLLLLAGAAIQNLSHSDQQHALAGTFCQNSPHQNLLADYNFANECDISVHAQAVQHHLSDQQKMQSGVQQLRDEDKNSGYQLVTAGKKAAKRRNFSSSEAVDDKGEERYVNRFALFKDFDFDAFKKVKTSKAEFAKEQPAAAGGVAGDITSKGGNFCPPIFLDNVDIKLLIEQLKSSLRSLISN